MGVLRSGDEMINMAAVAVNRPFAIEAALALQVYGHWSYDSKRIPSRSEEDS